MNEPPLDIYTDRSRYMAGFECEWKRLLKYHAFGTGIERRAFSTPLATGTYTHMALESMLKNKAVGKDAIRLAVDPVTQAYREYATGTTLPIDEQCALVEGLSNAWGRTVLPWLLDNFDVTDIEEEFNVTLRSSQGAVNWMARPDFVARDKKTGTLTVHDFKTAASFYADRDVEEYGDNIQLMMNALAVQQSRGQVSHYYIHILQKGNEHSPSPLIYPWHRPAAPPFQPEDLQASYKYQVGGTTKYLGKTYSRIPIWQSQPVADWVWSMPDADCAKQTAVLGPYAVDYGKVDQFLRGLPGNENSWARRLQLFENQWSRWGTSDFMDDLDRTFPRTYKCYTYGSRCSFYGICHKHAGFDRPIGSGQYERRIPHHPQEQLREDEIV